MSKSNSSKTAEYIQRILQDDSVQEQLRGLASGLQGAYRRARKQHGGAMEDKRFYGNLRQVASSARNVTKAFRPPEPEPPHRLRKLLLIGLATAGAIALTAKLQRLETERRRAADSGSSSVSHAGTPGPSATDPHPVPSSAA